MEWFNIIAYIFAGLFVVDLISCATVLFYRKKRFGKFQG